MSQISSTQNAGSNLPANDVTIEPNKSTEILKAEGKQELNQAEAGTDKLVKGAGEVANAAIDASKTGASGVAGALKSAKDGVANKASWAGQKLSHAPSTISQALHSARLRVAAPIGTETLSAKTTLGLGALLGTLAGIAKYSSVEVLIHASHLAAGSAMLLGLYLLYKLIDRARHSLPENIDASTTTVGTLQSVRRFQRIENQIKTAQSEADAEATRLKAEHEAKQEQTKIAADKSNAATAVSQSLATAKLDTSALVATNTAPKAEVISQDAPTGDTGSTQDNTTGGTAPVLQDKAA